MAVENIMGAGGGETLSTDARPTLLRVLPCVDSAERSRYFRALQAVEEVDLLPVALASTVTFRAQNEQPDAIVIATERLAASIWETDNCLGELTSAIPTVLLAAEISASLQRRAARLHIRSLLPLDVSNDQLVAAIRATMVGLAVTSELYSSVSGGQARWNVEDRMAAGESLVEPLTTRETDVLSLIARGHGNKEIASRLDISEHTAKFHVSSILGKLGAASRTEAVTIGIMRGLVAI